jgi:hypothetical protein
MSYCRWSSLNWKCDLYVYDSGGVWITHVAGRRRIGPILPDTLGLRLNGWLLYWAGWAWNKENGTISYEHPWRRTLISPWFWLVGAWHRLHMWSVSMAPLRDITLLHAGECFSDPTPGACADRLEELRRIGYVVPQYAIDNLRDEQASL